jgi:hypothetical protein
MMARKAIEPDTLRAPLKKQSGSVEQKNRLISINMPNISSAQQE